MNLRLLGVVVLLSSVGWMESAAQPFAFELRRTDLPASVFGRVVPYDRDGDGDVDLLVSGASSMEADHPQAFAAGAGAGTGANVHISYATANLATPTWLGAGAAADVNRDGYPDVLITGTSDMEVGAMNEPARARTDLFLGRADGALERSESRLPAVYGGMVAWADVNGDGAPDVLLAGIDESGDLITDVFLNDGAGQFDASGSALPQLALGAADWADIDNDGDPDLALSGIDEGGGFHSLVALNEAGTLVVTQQLEPLAYSSVSWGDFDADGDPDLVLTGARLTRVEQFKGVSVLYRNDSGTLERVQASIPGVLYGGAEWGDYDQDGDLDLAVAGLPSLAASPIAVVLENTSGTLRTKATLPGSYGGTLAWADVDADQDLDLILSGQDAAVIGFIRVIANVGRLANHPPSSPASLASDVQGPTTTLLWQPAADAATPAALLTYNVRVGTAPGQADVLPSMADAVSGRRFVSAPGNAGQSLRLVLRNLPQGTYSWSVQALDASFLGSAWAPDATLVVAGGKGGATSTESADVPVRFEVSKAYPNPFAAVTKLDLSLPDAAAVRVTVYDARGRRIALPHDRMLPAGRHELAWDGRSVDGLPVSAGVYLLEITAGSRREVRLAVRP